MKKVVPILGFVLIMVFGYVAAGPYLVIDEIKEGLTEENPDKLADNIDFVTLRNNLLDQLNESISKFASEDSEDNPFAAFAASLASRYVGSVANSIVSPEGLAAYMQGRHPAIEIGQKLAPPEKKNLLKNGRYSYDSVSEFSISVPNEQGDKATFVLRRKGFTWKLVNLILPVNEGL